MKSSYRGALVVFAVTLAMCAVGASAASAAPEWYVKKSGTWAKLTSAAEIKTPTHLNFTDSGYRSGVTFSCAAEMKRVLETGGVGKITEYVANSCTQSGESICESPTAKAVNLPWKTELYTEGSQTRERIVSGGGGTPGWEFDCGGSFADRCNFNTSANMKTELGSGNVLAVYKAGESNKTNCTSGENKGQLEGEVVLPHPAGTEALAAGQVTVGEWRQGGSPLSESVGTTTKGVITLADTEGGFIKVECESTGEGTAGPGAANTVTKWTASKCITRSGSCENPSMNAALLPWSSQLYDVAGTTQDLTSAGAGYNMYCNGFITDKCTGSLVDGMKDVTGGVEATLGGERLRCTFGGSEAGTVKGYETVKTTTGGTLEVK